MRKCASFLKNETLPGKNQMLKVALDLKWYPSGYLDINFSIYNAMEKKKFHVGLYSLNIWVWLECPFLLFSSSLCSKSPDASNSSFFISIRISTLFSMATFLAPVRHSFLGLPYAWGSGVVPQFFISSDPVSDCLLGSLLFKGVQRAFYLQMWGLWQPSWLRSLPFASSVPLIPSLFLLTV